MNPCLRSKALVSLSSKRSAVMVHRSTAVTSHRVLLMSTRALPSDHHRHQDEFPMKLAEFIQKRHQLEQERLADRWNKLAELTLDPKIIQVSETLSDIQDLPTTLTQAMADSRPCIISTIEDPNILINVNEAWCKLSGYTRDESLNQTIPSLMHGPDTIFGAEQKIVDQMGSGKQSVGGVVTHYTKSGRKFQDLMQFGTIALGADVAQGYIVGVLQEVS